MSRFAKKWRIQIVYWTDTALGLKEDEELIIPCKGQYYQQSYVERIKDYISEMCRVCPDSVYKFVDIFPRTKKGFRYLVFQKKKVPPNIAYIRSKIDSDKAIAVLLQSKYTRIGQIKEMLISGTSSAEIRSALGKEISVGEKEYLDKFDGV